MYDGFQRVIADCVCLIPCHGREAVGFDVQDFHFRPRRPFAPCHDAFGVNPCVADFAARNYAPKVDVGLVKAAIWVMKFVDQAHIAHAYGEAGFFHDFASQIVGQTAVWFRPTTGCAPQVGSVFPCIHQQQSVFLHDNGAGRKANGAFHAPIW